MTTHDCDAAEFDLSEDDRDRILAEMAEAFGDGENEPWWWMQEQYALAELRREVKAA